MVGEEGGLVGRSGCGGGAGAGKEREREGLAVFHCGRGFNVEIIIELTEMEGLAVLNFAPGLQATIIWCHFFSPFYFRFIHIYHFIITLSFFFSFFFTKF